MAKVIYKKETKEKKKNIFDIPEIDFEEDNRDENIKRRKIYN